MSAMRLLRIMTAVVDIGLVTKKCLCFTNLQT